MSEAPPIASRRRFGSIVALYGVANTRRLIRDALGLPDEVAAG